MQRRPRGPLVQCYTSSLLFEIELSLVINAKRRGREKAVYYVRC